MFARLTTTLLATEERDATTEIVENLLPTLEGLPGFEGLVVLSNPETHVIHGITLWENAEALERSELVMDGIRDAETAGRGVVAQQTGAFRVAAIHLTRH